MSVNEHTADAQVLRWPGKLFSAEDLRHVQGQRELILQARALLTPLAADELRARGIRITRQDGHANGLSKAAKDSALWSCIQETTEPLVMAAVESLKREGIVLAAIDLTGQKGAARVKAIADIIRKADVMGGVWFCKDGAQACCIANRVRGVRAAAAASAMQTARALASVGANLIVVELPGRTFFEVRQILKTAARATPVCPAEVAQLLQELDGHAHR